MKIRFLPPAERELRRAVRYYNIQRAGLGNEFRDEIRNTLKRIAQLPHAWNPLGGNFRRCQTQRFPYGVIYEPLPDEIIIIAIAHLHREPEYWYKRAP